MTKKQCTSRVAERLEAMIESRRAQGVDAVCVMCGARWDGEHKPGCWVPDLRAAVGLLQGGSEAP